MNAFFQVAFIVKVFVIHLSFNILHKFHALGFGGPRRPEYV